MLHPRLAKALIPLTALAIAAATAQAAPRSSEAGGKKAERQVAQALKADDLKPGKIDCRRNSCRWKASLRTAGWRYGCGGRTRGGPKRFDLTPCRLKAPKLAPLSKGSQPQLGFGYNVGYKYNHLAPIQEGDLVVPQGAGADTVRTALYWTEVERFPGVYLWTTYDSAYQRMLERGQRPLFIILGTPCWAAPSQSECDQHFTSIPPADSFFDDYARFTALAAARYPEAVGFEVWNEPNTQAFWWPGPQPERYARLLSTTHDAVKATAPSARVISGGLYPVREDKPGAQMSFGSFLHRVYAAEGTRIADAIGFHPYPSGKPEGHIRDIRRLIARLRDVMVAFRDEARPIWITEIGFSTSGPPKQRYDEQKQANRLVELYRTLRRVPGSPVTLIHTLFDTEGPADDIWNGMGVIRADHETRKPAYCAVAAARGMAC